MMGARVYLLLGTKKGGFILESDERRAAWSLRGSFCDSWPIYHMAYDPKTGTIHAGGGDNWYGPAVWSSPDLGRTWTHSSEGITYGDDGPKISKVWHVAAAHGTLFAGVDPAGLFRSDDGGASWTHVAGLRAHPTCPSWAPGNGGLCLH
ncbi:MAG: WD40/YVTN/BNR-like repeat-containing protein, partial [Chloroflexota bacterium]